MENRGFTLVSLPGTRELVWGKRVRSVGDYPVTLRVYSSIVEEKSRDVGEDAIRVALVAKIPDDNDGSPFGSKIVGIGRSKRVNRVPGWRNRLAERIAQWEELLATECPTCGAPMKERKGPKGKFYGCCRYPDCRKTVDIPKETEPKEVDRFAPMDLFEG